MQTPKELGQDGHNEDVATLIENLNDAIQTLGDTGAGATVKSIWKRAREKITKCCKKDTDGKNDVEKRLERIEKAVQALRPSKPAYSDILKGTPERRGRWQKEREGSHAKYQRQRRGENNTSGNQSGAGS